MIFVFCLQEKQTNKQTNTWVTLTQARGTISNISLFFKRKREGGLVVLLCLLSAATKAFENLKTQEVQFRCK